MIKFMATHPENGRKILGLGLSHGNVERLMKGLPIHFNAEQMGLADIRCSEVVLFAGESEESMQREMQEKGLLDGTRIIEETETKQ